jgi:hypothetical protein
MTLDLVHEVMPTAFDWDVYHRAARRRGDLLTAHPLAECHAKKS